MHTSNSGANNLIISFFLSSTKAYAGIPKNGALKITPATLRLGLLTKKLNIVSPPML